MSKFFGNNKKKSLKQLSEIPVPRTLEAITTDYNNLKAQAGEIQYQIYALTKNLEQINQGLLNLNHEGAARQKLDNETKQTEKEILANV